MTSSAINGRQVAPELTGIRQDHVERYAYVCERLEHVVVIDAACGVGYGSRMLADAAQHVYAYDLSVEALDYGRKHYAHPRIDFIWADLQNFVVPDARVAVSFETIEHLEDPAAFLKLVRSKCAKLFASVPNEAVVPFDIHRHKYHVRHYTEEQICILLKQCGWNVLDVQYQAGKMSPVGDATSGQTIVLTAE
jgi:2-polyprenyl-3-methyl-5-hydroxy-6-metoxy-1,4-benzoquinol methylase